MTESNPAIAANINPRTVTDWGPYLSNRQWGTVREMYNLGPMNYHGNNDGAWSNLGYNESRSTAYQFGEDGIFGISDSDQYLCFSPAFWNHHDDHIKERFFGLPGLFGENEGKLGEDVKELYYYLDNAKDHSYMRALYKYPCFGFPYKELISGNQSHEKVLHEYELLDTEAFAGRDYFDIYIEYAKDLGTNSIYVRIHIRNRSTQTASLTVLPMLWFRNVWDWGQKTAKPRLTKCHAVDQDTSTTRAGIKAEYSPDQEYAAPSSFYLWGTCSKGAIPSIIMTENETDPKTRQCKEERWEEHRKVTYWRHLQFASSAVIKPSTSERWKNSISDHIIARNAADIHDELGTKAAFIFENPDFEAGGCWEIYLRLYTGEMPERDSALNTMETCQSVIASRRNDYQSSCNEPGGLSDSHRNIYRQSLATLLWNKQFYHFNASKWFFFRQLFIDRHEQAKTKSPNFLEAAKTDLKAQFLLELNENWQHMAKPKIMIMPDKWEFPYFCAWDTAFHAVTLALVDGNAAMQMLDQLVSSDCMHSSGQIPGCEFEFSDVHPPIHAWAILKVYEQTHDRRFLEEMVWKLWKNFAWWTTQRKISRRHVDPEQQGEVVAETHYYRGGFLGLDNIAVVDRNHFTEDIVYVEQVDSAGWVALFALNLLQILVILGSSNSVNSSHVAMAEHCLKTFLGIEKTLNQISEKSFTPSWSMEDYWYYDILRIELKMFKMDLPLRVRSLVGIIPTLATQVISGKISNPIIQVIESFCNHVDNKATLSDHIKQLHRPPNSPGDVDTDGQDLRTFEIALVNEKKFVVMLDRILNENEFLSDYGLRSLSKYHDEHPFSLEGLLENKYGNILPIHIGYEPGRSASGVFGSKNSNWRGPIWVQMNYLFIDMLRQRSRFQDERDCKRPFPTLSEERLTYAEIADQLSLRLIRLFESKDELGRPCHGQNDRSIQFYRKQNWTTTYPEISESELILFYEFFHGENGSGLGASHQSWTTIVANLMHDLLSR